MQFDSRNFNQEGPGNVYAFIPRKIVTEVPTGSYDAVFTYWSWETAKEEQFLQIIWKIISPAEFKDFEIKDNFYLHSEMSGRAVAARNTLTDLVVAFTGMEQPLVDDKLLRGKSATLHIECKRSQTGDKFYNFVTQRRPGGTAKVNTSIYSI